MRDVARSRRIDERTVLDKCYRQLGLSSVVEFDTLIENWLLQGESRLRRRIERRSTLRAKTADKLAITRFFGGKPGSPVAAVTRPPSRPIGFLKPFRPKADLSYVQNVQGGSRVASRYHEQLVNDFAAWLESRGLKPGRNKAIDLGLEEPPVVIEAEFVLSWPRSIREAIGQLYEYPYFQVARPDAALVFLASKPIPRRWLSYLEDDRHIAVAWRAAGEFVLSSTARAAIGLRTKPGHIDDLAAKVDPPTKAAVATRSPLMTCSVCLPVGHSVPGRASRQAP